MTQHPGHESPEDLGVSAANGAQGAAYTLVLEYPPSLRKGDPGVVRLRVVPGNAASEQDLANAAAAATARPPGSGAAADEPLGFQARLEAAGAAIRPEGDITAGGSAANGTEFLWTIRAIPNSGTRGTVWTFLIPMGASDLNASRRAISAQPLEIKVTTVVGLSGPNARVLGAVLLVLATALGMAPLDRTLRRASRRARGQRE
jgi:hypothetical protein